MPEPDMTGIDPLRLAEARRRIDILDEYLALDRTAVSDATTYAKRIGVSRSQFYTLAKAWRLHRDPRLLGLNKGYSASRDYGIASRALAIMEEELGCAEELDALVSAVTTRCAREGVPAPSPQTVRDRFRGRQARTPRIDGPRRVLISRMWFRLPVGPTGTEEMPMLLTATLIPERIIVAHELSTSAAKPLSVQRLLERVHTLRSVGARKRGLLIDRADRLHARDVLDAFGFDRERDWHGSVQREASRHFAGRLGDLDAIFQRGSARPLVTGSRPKVGAITRQQAEDLIDAAISLNNQRAGSMPVEFDMRAR